MICLFAQSQVPHVCRVVILSQNSLVAKAMFLFMHWSVTIPQKVVETLWHHTQMTMLLPHTGIGSPYVDLANARIVVPPEVSKLALGWLLNRLSRWPPEEHHLERKLNLPHHTNHVLTLLMPKQRLNVAAFT